MDTELAYLAGFFDGEGCVSVRRSNDSYSMAVEVTQLNPSPLIRFQKRFGGRVYMKRDKRGYRPLFAWQIVASGAVKVLEALRPYLDGKAEEADVALALQVRISNPVQNRSEELAARQLLFEQCRDLKQRSYEKVELPVPAPTIPDHKVKRIGWAKPKPPVQHRVKAAQPPRSTGYDRKKRPVDAADIGILRGIYEDHGLAAAALEYGVSRQTIFNWLDRYGVAKTGRTEASEARRKAASAASWVSPGGAADGPAASPS